MREERKVDRRVGRTRRRLKEALLGLIEERDYGSITIRDITERADVARSTFYSHFDSKEDLLFAGLDRWLRSLAQPPIDPSGTAAGVTAGGSPAEEHGTAGFRFARPLLDHVLDQRRFFRATLGRGGAPRLRRRINALLVELVRLELPPRPAETPAALEARAQCVAGAFIGLVAWWLDDPARLPRDAVDAAFQAAVAGSRHP